MSPVPHARLRVLCSVLGKDGRYLLDELVNEAYEANRDKIRAAGYDPDRVIAAKHEGLPVQGE